MPNGPQAALDLSQTSEALGPALQAESSDGALLSFSHVCKTGKRSRDNKASVARKTRCAAAHALSRLESVKPRKECSIPADWSVSQALWAMLQLHVLFQLIETGISWCKSRYRSGRQRYRQQKKLARPPYR